MGGIYVTRGESRGAEEEEDEAGYIVGRGRGTRPRLGSDFIPMEFENGSRHLLGADRR